MDLLRNLTAVDWQDEGIEVVYHLFSMRRHHSVCIKTRLRGEHKTLGTVCDECAAILLLAGGDNESFQRALPSVAISQRLTGRGDAEAWTGP